MFRNLIRSLGVPLLAILVMIGGLTLQASAADHEPQPGVWLCGDVEPGPEVPTKVAVCDISRGDQDTFRIPDTESAFDFVYYLQGPGDGERHFLTWGETYSTGGEKTVPIVVVDSSGEQVETYPLSFSLDETVEELPLRFGGEVKRKTCDPQTEMTELRLWALNPSDSGRAVEKVSVGVRRIPNLLAVEVPDMWNLTDGEKRWFETVRVVPGVWEGRFAVDGEANPRKIQRFRVPSCNDDAPVVKGNRPTGKLKKLIRDGGKVKAPAVLNNKRATVDHKYKIVNKRRGDKKVGTYKVIKAGKVGHMTTRRLKAGVHKLILKVKRNGQKWRKLDVRGGVHVSR